MNKKDKYIKSHNLLLEQYHEWESKKSKLKDYESEKDKKLMNKSSIDIKLIKIINLYIASKDAKVKMTLEDSISSLAMKHHNLDIEIKISKSTFQREVAHYKEFGALNKHGNVGKTPHNKTLDSKRIELINKFDELIELIYKFHGQKVPLTVSAIFHFLGLEYNFMNKTLPVGQRAFLKWISGEYKFFISKFTNKMKRKIMKKLNSIKSKSVEPLIVEQDPFQTIKRKGSPFRELGKPGTILQWDGSQEMFYKKSTLYRMHVIDQKTLYSMGISFVKHENNFGYIKLLRQLLKHGKPSIIKADRRVGVDPAHEMALVANVCRMLGIIIHAKSDSTHKADMERLNGPSHSYFNAMAAIKDYKTIKSLNEKEEEITKDFNKYFKKDKPDFSHLEQITELENKMLNMENLKVIKFNSEEAIIFEKQVYSPYDSEGKKVGLSRFDKGIVCYTSKDDKWLWTINGIYKLERETNKLHLSDMISLNKSGEAISKHFVNNGVIILNNETYDFIYNDAKDAGRKESIRYKRYEMDRQYNEMLNKKRRLMKEIEDISNSKYL